MKRFITGMVGMLAGCAGVDLYALGYLDGIKEAKKIILDTGQKNKNLS
jgi:hypothetical protein